VLLLCRDCLMRQLLRVLPQLQQQETRSAPEALQLLVMPGELLQ
jgi:hypothetical protein